MPLATELAWDALKVLINTAAGPNLPAVTRNDDVLRGFIASSESGVKFRAMMSDGNVVVLETEMGEGLKYVLSVESDIVLAVEGEPSDARDGVLDGMLAALKGVLFVDGVSVGVDGVFDGLTVETELQRKSYPAGDGRPPIEGWEFTVAMVVNASSPFG